ncbi:MAG: DUF2116 family Zn-ribbon domain-containing protein [Methanomassiliicoccales archaeon]|nr:MAG: DUF2116 family Zn-ribbon domain-containing protein [Methanomassiliicoccales archaeon]
MAENLPPHDHCVMCDDPIEVGERFCSDRCRSEHEAMLRKERDRNIYFLIGVVGLMIALALIFVFFGQ